MGTQRTWSLALSFDSNPVPDPAIVTNGLTTSFSMIGLAMVAWGVTAEDPWGLSGHGLASAVLFAIGALGWIGWRICLYHRDARLLLVSLLTMTVAGGILAPCSNTALVFVGVASLAATIRWRLSISALVVVAGLAATLGAVVANGSGSAILVNAVAATLAGSLIGVTRRQSLEAAAQVADAKIAEARAVAEEARAEGRNHLARELHDVLAHTLSALSIRLEALDSVLGDDAAPTVRDELEATKRLVREGLGEARGAVRALRDDVDSLEGELSRLVVERHATLSVTGTPRAVRPEVALTLYRVAQEALTNATKHAPGAPVDIHLDFDEGVLRLCVQNGAGDTPGQLAQSGGGFGLQGIRERVLLVGGTVEAGPSESGWLVEAEVPA